MMTGNAAPGVTSDTGNAAGWSVLDPTEPPAAIPDQRR